MIDDCFEQTLLLFFYPVTKSYQQPANHLWLAVLMSDNPLLFIFFEYVVALRVIPCCPSQLCSSSRIFQQFMETEGSQEPSTDPHPQPDQSIRYCPVLFL
jgi:hypothetical protein